MQKQYILDFTSRQVERRAMLHAALCEVRRTRNRVTPLHWSILQWLLNLDDECLRKSHADIAEALFATVPTLRRSIADLGRWGLVSISERIYQTNGQGPNETRLDWQGIRTWHARLLARQGLYTPPAQPEQGGDQSEQPPAHSDQGAAHIEHAYKENTSSGFPFQSFPPPPVPKKPEEEEGRENETGSIGVPAPAGQAPAWKSIEQRLRALGLREVAPAIAQARRAGMPAETFTDAIDFFQANHGAWGAGALFYFTRGWQPDMPVDEQSLWPTPDERWRVTARRLAQEIATAGRAKQVPDELIRDVMAKHGCLWFAQELLEVVYA